jgi:pimeloyl-ACP methyl ester carboxylesterase
MVLPGVAQFTRVCAYDRPGTIGSINPDLDPYGPPFYPSRSDPVPQPRTSKDMVAELHALLQAAHVPGSYVLVGHSGSSFASTPAPIRTKWSAWCLSTPRLSTSGIGSRWP